MAVTDEAVMVILTCAINYLIVYRKNRFIADIFFIVIGLGTLLLNTTQYMKWTGVFISFMAFIALLYDWKVKGQK